MSTLLYKFRQLYKVWIILGDLALVYISYVISFLVKFKGELPEFNYISFLNAIPFILVTALIFFDKYKVFAFYRKTFYDILKSLISAISFLGITAIAITYMLQGFSFPRSVLLLAPIIQLFALGLFHGTLLLISRSLSTSKTIMIVYDDQTDTSAFEKIDRFLEKDKVDKIYKMDIKKEKTIFKKLNEMNEIFLISDLPAQFKAEIMKRCLGGKQVIYIVPHLYEISLIDSRFIHLDDTPVFMVDRLGLSTEQKIIKRAFDLFFSLVGLLFLSPFMLIVAILIKVTSPGPVFYKQERMTQLNKVFSIYKYRTMLQDAESLTGPVLASQNDPRVTTLGRILRRLRIDEFPQLFNVFLGHMSLVGPRPERPYFVEQYIQNLPEYNHRFLVKAGITGYAQIFGNYDTTPDDKLRYDLMYIRNYSLLLDIKLIFGTFKVLFTVGSESKSSEKLLKVNGASSDYKQERGSKAEGVALKENREVI